MTYDFVIIGSGLGGLVSAAILSKEGYSVCVLEKNRLAGGNLQSFQRDGHTFDTGLHYIGSMEEGQTLHRFFRYLGILPKIRLKQMDAEGYDRLSFGCENHMYHHSQGWDNFRESLGQQFPTEKAGIRTYVDAIRNIIRSIPLYDLESAGSYQLEPAILQGSAMDLIRSVTSDRRLISVLAGANALYHGAVMRTPLYIHACIRNSFVSSAWRPVGGSQHIADALADVIREHGGILFCDSEVHRFEYGAEGLSAALTRDGRRFTARNFISDVHPATTLQWIEPGKIRKPYRNRILSLENTPGFFSVYTILKENSFPYLNHNHFHYSSDRYFDDRLPGSWPHTYLLYTPAETDEQDCARTASLLSFMPYEEFSRFDIKERPRGEEYEAFKEEKAQALISAAEKQYPGLRKHLVSHFVSTPLTFKDYTGTWNGSAYGILKDASDPARAIIVPRSKIPNLYFTGQNLNIHGILGTTISAVITASSFTGFRELVQKIVHA